MLLVASLDEGEYTMEKKNSIKMTMDERLNTIRAGVLGANDGVLTVVGVLFSVAAATNNHFAIFIAGLSDLLACALSMASGEYHLSVHKLIAKKLLLRKNNNC